MTKYTVKVFDNKNKHLDTIEVDNDNIITKKQQNELIGYCRMFVDSKSSTLDISIKDN